MTIAGANYREGVAYSPDGAMYVTGAANGSFADATFTGDSKYSGPIYVYNGTIDATNFERIAIQYSVNVAQILSQAGGTGTIRDLSIVGGGGGARLDLANAANSVILAAVAGGKVVFRPGGSASNIWEMDASNHLLGISATGALGYGTGAGGVITQATSKSTGVTLSRPVGEITMNGAALAAAAIASFTLTNTVIAANDVLILNHASVGTVGGYTLNAQCAAGSAVINVRNSTAGSLSEAIVIRFAVVKGVAA